MINEDKFRTGTADQLAQAMIDVASQYVATQKVSPELAEVRKKDLLQILASSLDPIRA
jgi:hypothetical protein